MEELKIEYEFNLHDFEEMEDIEHTYFPNDNITKAKEAMEWYKKNKFTCVGVRNSNSEVIASVNILPLKKDVFYSVYKNRMNEADILAYQIEEYKDNGMYYIYLSSISISKPYRNNYKVITTLITACIELLESLSKRNIQMKMVMADASTAHGEKICKKLLGMDYITDTSHNSRIYCEDGEKFLEAINKFKSFIK